MLLFALLALELPADPPDWVKVAICGEFRGYQTPGMPKGFTLTPRHLDEMVANFAIIRTDVVFDLDHQTVRKAENGQPAPAQGWIKALEVRMSPAGQPELWARCTWTSSGDTYIREKQYRYVSPVILFRTLDRRTGQDLGCSLHSVALTNTPFLDELPPLTASLPEMSPVKNLLLLLSLPATATEADVEARVADLARGRGVVCASLGLTPTATDAEISARFAALARSAAVGEATLATLSVDAAVPTMDAVNAAKAALTHVGYVTLAAHEAVASELVALKAGAALEAARAAGKITPANEAWATETARTNPAGFAAWCAVAPVLVGPADRTRRGPATTPASKLTDVELAVCTQLNLTPEQFAPKEA